MTVTDPEDLATGGCWRPLAADRDALARYTAATGWDGPGAPPGLAVALARRAFTAGRSLPPGGVLMEITVDPGDALTGATDLDVRVDVAQRRTGGGHRVVTITTLLRPAGASATEVRYVLRWPA